MVHFECSSRMKEDEGLNLRSLDLAKSIDLRFFSLSGTQIFFYFFPNVMIIINNIFKYFFF